jgi:hypothetical protein
VDADALTGSLLFEQPSSATLIATANMERVVMGVSCLPAWFRPDL